jgi:hypothetical protein
LNKTWITLSEVKEIMNMKKLNVALAILGVAVMVGNAQTATSGVVGYSKLDIPVGGRLIAPVFIKTAVFTGSATISSGVLSISGSLTPSALNQTAFNNRPNFPKYYAKVTSSGSNEGLVLDVVSNTASTITVSGASGLSGALSIEVVPHYTLLDFANASSNLLPYVDAVTFYDSGNAKRTYYYTGSGFVADDYTTPADQVVVYPGSGFILNAGAVSSVTMTGCVNQTKTLVPVYAGESIVAPIDPSGITKIANSNLGSAIAPYVDAASTVLLDGSLATTTYYTNGSDMLDDSYTALDASAPNTPKVAAGNGFIINANADGYWVQSPVIPK